MASLNVPFLPKATLIARAATFLRENGLTEIPVNIEFVAEQKYGASIVPFSGLLREYGTDAFSASDFSTIYVDEFVYYQRPTRLRFTVAHELGHRILHTEYLKSLVFATVDEWVNALDGIDHDDYRRMEFQADTFAGLVLVPQPHLETGFAEQLQLLMPQIEEAKAAGLKREDYLDNVVYAISDALLPQFDVSLKVLEIRLANSELAGLIP